MHCGRAAAVTTYSCCLLGGLYCVSGQAGRYSFVLEWLCLHLAHITYGYIHTVTHVPINYVVGFLQILVTFPSYTSNACHSFSGVAIYFINQLAITVIRKRKILADGIQLIPYVPCAPGTTC